MTAFELLRSFYMSVRNPVLWHSVWRDYWGKTYRIKSNDWHLEQAVKWIATSQDVNDDEGSSSHYAVHGWLDSFPETTGYIIPTLLDYADYTSNEEYKQRAVRMGEFLLSIQFENGAFQSGNLSAKKKSPSVFNTGQIIFGLCRLYKEINDERYKSAAIRAADWVCSVQDEDGCWRKGLSIFARQTPHAYNVRTAWSLLKVYEISNNEQYLQCNIKNVEWTLTQMNSEHWFDSNSFWEGDPPLTHNIAYTMRGILESGLFHKNKAYIEHVKASADHILNKYPDVKGLFPAKMKEDWSSDVNYSCLTGNLQLGIICGKLYDYYGDSKYLNTLKEVNESHKALQVQSRNSKINGATKGAHPFWGAYCPYSYPNWATKFFIDALLIEEKVKAT